MKRQLRIIRASAVVTAGELRDNGPQAREALINVKKAFAVDDANDLAAQHGIVLDWSDARWKESKGPRGGVLLVVCVRQQRRAVAA